MTLPFLQAHPVFPQLGVENKCIRPVEKSENKAMKPVAISLQRDKAAEEMGNRAEKEVVPGSPRFRIPREAIGELK
jgi:hypothetical protein